MSYRHLPLTCECGQIPARILEVGFTAEHELVIHYWCSQCKRVVCVSKPLAECWKDCPQPVAEEPVEDMASEDARFLHSIGVSLI
jgi:hypothetical protein